MPPARRHSAALPHQRRRHGLARPPSRNAPKLADQQFGFDRKAWLFQGWQYSLQLCPGTGLLFRFDFGPRLQLGITPVMTAVYTGQRPYSCGQCNRTAAFALEDGHCAFAKVLSDFLTVACDFFSTT